MLITKESLGYNDISIVPTSTSEINHRYECSSEKGGFLPIFTAPMSTVVNEKNYEVFKRNGIIPIIPWSVDYETRIRIMNESDWIAVSLAEFEKFIEENDSFRVVPNIVVDVACGNMSRLIELCRKAKEKYGDSGITLMTGNIANPETYEAYCEAHIDYCRTSIGSGMGCITASNTGVYVGKATIINECWEKKSERIQNGKFATKIVADGGIRGYKDVCKALALGADYVMIGGVLASTLESAANTFTVNRLNEKKEVSPDELEYHEGVFYLKGMEIYRVVKHFYGMASKEGQMDLFGRLKKTSEGISKDIPCTITLPSWVQNMTYYLRTAMSYCGISDIYDFNPDNVTTRVLSKSEQETINK